MADKTVYYIGHSRDGVVVAMPDGEAQQVDQGGALETTAEHAKSLLQQSDNWTATPPGKAKPKPEKEG